MTSEPRAGLLAELLESQGVELDVETVRVMEHLARRLLEESQKTNLTAIRDYRQVLVRHYLDCLMPLAKNWKLPEGWGCDIGTGAGFPGLVFALVRREKEWTLVESKTNKYRWLCAILEELGLSNVAVVQGRAEVLGHEPGQRERYGLCLARAVAKGPVMLEYGLPLVKVGGELWCWQGEDYSPDSWQEALRLLGGEVGETFQYVLPTEESAKKKQLVRILKTCSTPERFPRRTGIPKKRPL